MSCRVPLLGSLHEDQIPGYSYNATEEKSSQTFGSAHFSSSELYHAYMVYSLVDESLIKAITHPYGNFS